MDNKIIRQLRRLPGDLFGVKRFFNDRNRLFTYLRKQLAKHKSTFDGSNIRDYIDAFIVEMKSRQATPQGSHHFEGNSDVNE